MRDRKNPNRVAVDDRVGYAAEWLRNTGQMVGEAGALRGVVVSMSEKTDHWVAEVLWSDGTTSRALACNLARVGGPGWSRN